MSAQTLIGRVLAAAVLLFAVPAYSAVIMLPGNTVNFFYDDNQPGMAAYGTLTAVNDSIFATPTGFRAESADGINDMFSALGTVIVVLKSGYKFESVTVAQQGDYQLDGVGAAVTSSAILDVSDTAVPTTTVSTALGSTSDFTIQGSLTSWSSDATVDLSTAMWNGVGSIDLTLDSMLDASTLNQGELAFIQNKLVGSGLMTVVTVPLPLPAGLWLFVSGFVMLFSSCRRRK